MKSCPNCNNYIGEEVKFCPFCGFAIKEYKKKRVKNIIIGLLIFFICLFIGELVYNSWFEKENSKPYEVSLNLGDTTATIKTRLESETFNNSLKWEKIPRVIYIDLIMEQKIEPWQIESVSNNKRWSELSIVIETKKEKLKSYNTKLEKGKNLEYSFKITNTDLMKYIKIKKALIEPNSIELTSLDSLSPSSAVRKKAKKQFLAYKEQQRQIQARQAALELYQSQLRQMYNNYYYYGYGY